MYSAVHRFCRSADGTYIRVKKMHIEKFADLFSNRTDCFYEQIPNQRRYRAIKTELEKKHFEQHLSGEMTLALPALSLEGTSKWLAWDSDFNDGELQMVQDFLESEGWICLRESKRHDREGHLWLVLDTPISSEMARRFAAEVNERLKTKRLEVIPKQSKPGSMGSSLRLPLGINKKPGVWKRGWFEGPSKNVQEQIEWLLNQPLNSAEQIELIAQELLERDRRRRDHRFIITTTTSSSFTAPFCRNSDYRKTDLLNSLPPTVSRRRCGNDWVLQCPVCEQEGHDKSKDNLRIKGDDGTVFACWYGGQPGKIHTARQILDAFSATFK